MTMIERARQILSQFNINFSKLQLIIDTTREIVAQHYKKLSALLTAILVEPEFFQRELRLVPLTIVRGELLNAIIHDSKIYFLPIIHEVNCSDYEFECKYSRMIYIPTANDYRSEPCYSVVGRIRTMLKVIVFFDYDYYVIGLPPPEDINNDYPDNAHNIELEIARKVNSMIASLNLLLNLREIVSFVRYSKLLDLTDINLQDLSMSLDVNLKMT